MSVNRLNHTAILAGFVLLTGCSQINKVFDNNGGVGYKEAGAIASLEVPPDLTTPKYDSTFSVNKANSRVTASALGRPSIGKNKNAANVKVLPESTAIQLKISKNERWLEVSSPASILWNKIQGFWSTMGVELKRNEPTIGVMETNWIQSRGHLPQGSIQRALGSILKNATDSGIRDRYNVRLEKVSAKMARVYITHRGAEQIVTDTGNKWEMRPRRPAAEAEMLNRLKAYLQGGNIEKTSSSSDKQASISRSSGVATLSETGGKVSLKVPDGYDQAWIRTSSVLTNAGFALDGENKSKGLYAARWEGGGDKEKGFFKRLIKFDNKLLKVGAEQLIHVSQSDGGSRLRVLDKNGKSIDVAVARKILERLKTEYNR